MEEVSRGFDLKPRPARHLPKTRFSVSCHVVIDDVMIGPKGVKCRYGSQQLAFGRKEFQSISQRRDGITQMLENIQHQDEGEVSTQAKTSVEVADVNARMMRPIVADKTR